MAAEVPSFITNKRLFKDFALFAKHHIASRDVDPMYWVIPEGCRLMRLTNDQKIWFTLLFTTWYNLASAERVFRLYREPQVIDKNPGFSFGLGRRLFRGNDSSLVHVEAAVKAFGASPWKWVNEVAGEGGTDGWKRMFDAFMELPFAGHWSAYKWCKHMKSTWGLPIVAPQVGIAHTAAKNAGPVPCMVRLTGLDWKECATNVELHHGFHAALAEQGAVYNGLDGLDCGFCNFNGVIIGRYYVGKNIDSQQKQLKKAPSAVFWQARSVIPEPYRGELHGWNGTRKDLLVAYRDRKELVL